MHDSHQADDEVQVYRRILVLLYFALLITVPMYGFVAEVVAAGAETRDPGILKSLLLAVGGGTAAVVLFIRFSLIPPMLQTQTTDLVQRLNRLRVFYIVCFALSEAVALYGLVLRFLGASLTDVVLLYAGSLALFALCYPKTPQTLASGLIG